MIYLYHNKMNPVIIDNHVIFFDDKNIHIYSLHIVKKNYPNIDVDSLQTITYGNKDEDNRILNQLAIGLITVNDLFT